MSLYAPKKCILRTLLRKNDTWHETSKTVNVLTCLAWTPAGLIHQEVNHCCSSHFYLIKKHDLDFPSKDELFLKAQDFAELYAYWNSFYHYCFVVFNTYYRQNHAMLMKCIPYLRLLISRPWVLCFILVVKMNHHTCTIILMDIVHVIVLNSSIGYMCVMSLLIRILIIDHS